MLTDRVMYIMYAICEDGTEKPLDSYVSEGNALAAIPNLERESREAAGDVAKLESRIINLEEQAQFLYFEVRPEEETEGEAQGTQVHVVYGILPGGADKAFERCGNPTDAESHRAQHENERLKAPDLVKSLRTQIDDLAEKARYIAFEARPEEAAEHADGYQAW